MALYVLKSYPHIAHSRPFTSGEPGQIQSPETQFGPIYQDGSQLRVQQEVKEGKERCQEDGGSGCW